MRQKWLLFLLLFILAISGCSNHEQSSTAAEQTGKEAEASEIEPEPQPEPIPEPEPEVYTSKLTVVGDLMAHIVQLTDAFDPQTNTYQFDFAFDQVAPMLSRADYTIGNLETTLAGEENRGYTGYPEFNTPSSYAQALKNAGFDFLTTANNHSYDRRYHGLVKTIETLDEIGLAHAGTYTSPEEQNGPSLVSIDNILFAFVSFTYGTNGIPVPDDKSYSINLLTEEVITREIQEAKAFNPDFIIALPHMGNEYELIPNDVYVRWADFMLEAGADMVLASHPHVVQPAEYRYVTREDGTVHRGFVAYSLGNFISGQRTEPRDAGMMLHLDFTKIEGEEAELTNVSYSPTWVQYRNRSGNYHIRVLPVYEVLKDVETSSETYDLSQRDIERVKRVHHELSQRLLNRDIPLSDLQEEYVIEELTEK